MYDTTAYITFCGHAVYSKMIIVICFTQVVMMKCCHTHWCLVKIYIFIGNNYMCSACIYSYSHAQLYMPAQIFICKKLWGSTQVRL